MDLGETVGKILIFCNVPQQERLILTETCLSSVPSHMLSFFRLPKGVGKRFDFFRARLVWQEREGVRKYHLVNWNDVCQPRD